MNEVYLYGIVSFPPELPWEIRGLGGRPVGLLPWEKLAAVVSLLPSRRSPPTEAEAVVHETVVEQIMDRRPILPFRFNTLLDGEEAALSLLRARAAPFTSMLARVAGKVEMGLRVLWEPTGNATSEARRHAGHVGPGAAYLYRRAGDERRRAELRGTGEKLIERLQARWCRLSAESWLWRFPTDRLLLSGAYLIERGQVDAFRESVATTREEFPSLSFLVAGPWPPYHFVDGIQDGTALSLAAG